MLNLDFWIYDIGHLSFILGLILILNSSWSGSCIKLIGFENRLILNYHPNLDFEPDKI